MASKKSIQQDTTSTGEGMRLRKIDNEARIVVEPGERSLTDLRIAALDQDPGAMAAIIKAAGIATTPTARGVALVGYACGGCGGSGIVQTGEPCVTVRSGRYHAEASQTSPTTTVCGLCSHSARPSKVFVRQFGDSAKALDLHRLSPRPLDRDYVALRFQGQWHLGESATEVLARIAPRAFDPEADFTGLVISAPTRELALAALHEGLEPEWAGPVVTDERLRLVSLPWSRPNVSDANQTADVARERRAAAIKQLDDELKAERQRRLAQL